MTTRDNPAGGQCPIYIKNILPRGAAIEDGRWACPPPATHTLSLSLSLSLGTTPTDLELVAQVEIGRPAAGGQRRRDDGQVAGRGGGAAAQSAPRRPRPPPRLAPHQRPPDLLLLLLLLPHPPPGPPTRLVFSSLFCFYLLGSDAGSTLWHHLRICFTSLDRFLPSFT